MPDASGPAWWWCRGSVTLGIAALGVGILGVATFSVLVVHVFFGLGFLAIVVASIGLAKLRRERARPLDQVVAWWGMLLPIGFLLFAPFCMSIVAIPREPGARTQSQSRLKQMALAFHSYMEQHGRLPPAAICDAKGRPLLSWRVALLPFIAQGELYRQFKLDEPWDSPHNIKLLDQMPATYDSPPWAISKAAPSLCSDHI